MTDNWPGITEHWQTDTDHRSGCLGMMVAAAVSILLWGLLYLAWRAW